MNPLILYPKSWSSWLTQITYLDFWSSFWHKERSSESLPWKSRNPYRTLLAEISGENFLEFGSPRVLIYFQETGKTLDIRSYRVHSNALEDEVVNRENIISEKKERWCLFKTAC